MPLFGIFSKKAKSIKSSGASVKSSSRNRSSTVSSTQDDHDDYVLPAKDTPSYPNAPWVNRAGASGSTDSLAAQSSQSHKSRPLRSGARSRDGHGSPLSAPPTIRQVTPPSLPLVDPDDLPLLPPPSRTSIFNGLAFDHQGSGSTQSLPDTSNRLAISTTPRPSSSIDNSQPTAATPSKRRLFNWGRKASTPVPPVPPLSSDVPPESPTKTRPKLLTTKLNTGPRSSSGHSPQSPQPTEESFNLKSFRHVRPVSPGPGNSYTEAATSRTRALTHGSADRPSSPTWDVYNNISNSRSRGGSVGSESSQKVTAAAFRQAQQAHRTGSNLGRASPVPRAPSRNATASPAPRGTTTPRRISTALGSDTSESASEDGSSPSYPRRSSSLLPLDIGSQPPRSRPPRTNAPPESRSQHVALSKPAVPPIAARFMSQGAFASPEVSSPPAVDKHEDTPSSSSTSSFARTTGSKNLSRDETVTKRSFSGSGSLEPTSPRHSYSGASSHVSRPPRAAPPSAPATSTTTTTTLTTTTTTSTNKLPTPTRTSTAPSTLGSYTTSRASLSTGAIVSRTGAIQNPTRRRTIISDSDTSEDDEDAEEENSSDEDAPLSSLARVNGNNGGARPTSTFSNLTVRGGQGQGGKTMSSAASIMSVRSEGGALKKKPLVDLNSPSTMSPNSLPMPSTRSKLPGLVSRIPSTHSRSEEHVPSRAFDSPNNVPVPSRPFAFAYQHQQQRQHSAGSAASSTGDSSSGKLPLTPQDGSDAASSSIMPPSSMKNGSRSRQGSDGGTGRHSRKGSVTFQEPPYKEHRKSRGEDAMSKDANVREELRKERRRSEAKNAIELGKVMNGPAPILDDEDMEPSNFAAALQQQQAWNWQQMQMQLASGMPNMNMQQMQMQMQMNPNFMAAHQQAMMIAKQTYQMTVAQQALQAANDQWERGSNVSGFGALNMGGGMGGGMGGYGGMSMGGMPGMMGGGMPWMGGMPGMLMPPGTGSVYGGSTYGGGGSVIGVPTGGSNWGGSVYGESFGPSIRPQRANNGNSIAFPPSSFHAYDLAGAPSGGKSASRGSGEDNNGTGTGRRRQRTQTAPSMDRASLMSLGGMPPLPSGVNPPSSWRK